MYMHSIMTKAASSERLLDAGLINSICGDLAFHFNLQMDG